MADPTAVTGPPRAFTVVSNVCGWQLDAATADATPEGSNPTHQLFTVVLAWMNPATKQEWYEELARLARSSYESFGHHIDALGILAAGGVETRFVELLERWQARYIRDIALGHLFWLIWDILELRC